MWLRINCCVICFVFILFIVQTGNVLGAKRRRVIGRRGKSADWSNLRPPPTGLSFRLVPGAGDPPSVGVVEVMADTWEAACGDHWTLTDGDVVCRNLGYTRGADGVFTVFTPSTQHYPTVEVICWDSNQVLSECYQGPPDPECISNTFGAVACKENTGCPDGWLAGPDSCYQLPDIKVTRRRFAEKKCAMKGGHLVAIETEEENDWITHAFRQDLTGPILTAGVKEANTWLWRTSQVTDVGTTRRARNSREPDTTDTPLTDTKWFPGFQPNDVMARPTRRKKDTCLYLSSVFAKPDGSDVTLPYFFWTSDRCNSTRKTLVGGYRFMCERPKQRQEVDTVGCYRGIGINYRGTAHVAESGAKCIKWTDKHPINDLPLLGLGEHNYCRNPDEDERPWCWVSKNAYQFCDIPECTDVTTSTSESGCAENEFECGDHSCIAGSWKCDIEKDCPGGEDESTDCDYKLPMFKYTTGATLRDYAQQILIGTTKETCAKYCLTTKEFVCRSFSFQARTRECLLSNMNTLMVDAKPSRNTDLFEIDFDNQDSTTAETPTTQPTTTTTTPTTTPTTTTPSTTSSTTTTPRRTTVDDGKGTVPERSPTSTYLECLDGESAYMGKVAETENGFECQRWALNTPHAHKHHDDSEFPDGSVLAAENYCRTPDDDSQPWCYTTDPDERWSYCSIPKCQENCYTVATDYIGPTSKTTSGLECQSWNVNTPHEHKYHSNNDFPDSSVLAASNRCRAPDGDTQPWCYTVDPNKRWELCNVTKCPGGEFDFNATCGLRPREKNRRRRAVSDVMRESDDVTKVDFSLYDRIGKIFGGTEAVYGMYPWQAGVRRRLGGFLGWNMHHCGGTIIGEYWILSAAHCFSDLHRDDVIIRTGDHNNGFLDKHEQEFEVEAIISHENYDSTTYDSDIALIKLKGVGGRGIEFNDYVQPACLPDKNTPYTWSQKCLISGWGAHEEDEQSEHLKAARVPLIDDVTCRALQSSSLTSNMVCAGALRGGIDSCTGDSGGPLVCQINGHYTVMGVTSFGEGCAQPNKPGVYSRVTALIPWVLEKLAEHS